MRIPHENIYITGNNRTARTKYNSSNFRQAKAVQLDTVEIGRKNCKKKVKTASVETGTLELINSCKRRDDIACQDNSGIHDTWNRLGRLEGHF